MQSKTHVKYQDFEGAWALISQNPCYSTRQMFEESWLEEMPVGHETGLTYNVIVNTIIDWRDVKKPVVLANGLHNIVGETVVLYWRQTTNNAITIAAEFRRAPEAIVVSLLGKHPALQGQPPYASEFYHDILQDSHTAIRIMSDDKLSDEGMAVWKKLLAQGHKISVYDANSPGQSFITLSDVEDLDKFFSKTDLSYKRYQFVLTEDNIVHIETRSFFNLRRFRELSNTL